MGACCSMCSLARFVIPQLADYMVGSLLIGNGIQRLSYCAFGTSYNTGHQLRSFVELV